MENPTVQQLNLGTQVRLPRQATLRVDLVHNHGTHFIIGRPIGTVFNPVVGGPDTRGEPRVERGHEVRRPAHHPGEALGQGPAARAWPTPSSRARNYANDDQIPFSRAPSTRTTWSREYGPTPNEQRHRFVLSGSFLLPWSLRLSPIWTIASGVPMDILMPDASTPRPDPVQRNAGGREFKTAGDLNAYLTS